MMRNLLLSKKIGVLLIVFLIILFGSHNLRAGVTDIIVGAQIGNLTYGTSKSVTFQISFNRTGTNSSISGLSVSSTLPTGISAIWSNTFSTASGNHDPAPVTLTLTTSSNTSAGTYTFTVKSTSPTLISTGTLTISQAALMITANNQSKCYGQTLTFAGTEFTSSGLVNSDVISSVSLTSSGSGVAAASGSYSIVPSAATGLGNYTISYTNGTLTVIPANTITAPSVTNFCATNESSDITIVGSDMGSGASYQWQINTNANDLDNTYSYTNISGATLKDYNPGTITATKGYLRKVIGTCSSSSNIVKMNVTPGISGNTITSSTPTNNCGSFYANYINGSSPSGGNSNNFTFQWQSSTDGVNYTNIAGETSQHYYFPGGNATSTIYFRRIVYSGYCTSYSNVLFYNTKAAAISGNLTVNVGSTTQLTGSPSGGTWSSGTTSVATVNSAGLVSGVSGGTSIIIYTTTNGCINSATVTVTGASCTNVGITSATAAASPICSNATTTLTANGVVGTNALVTWWSGSGGSGTNYGTGLALPNASPGNYYARVTGDCGTPVEATVTVASKTNVGITSATAAASLICSNATTTLTANGVVGANALVTWWSGTGGTGTNYGTGLTLPNASPGLYYARVTGDCGSPVEATVTVASKTNVGITSATAAASSICSNATTTLTANGVVGTNALVTWWSGNGGTGTNYGTGLTLPNASPGLYYARVTGDCGAPVEALVTVVSSPNASIGSVFGASQLCIGETTTYLANAVVLGGGTGAWSTSDETIATVNASGLVTGIANGSCDIIYTITGGCGGIQTTKQALTVGYPGDPAVFGSDQWNVYVYNGTNLNLSSNTYRGYYSDSNLNFDTRNMWLANSTPSSATGYQGCSVDKLMTFVYKRKGFPCGLYTISVGHDDDASILVNGGDTWSAANWTYTPVAVPDNYFLDENSTVEFRVRNTGGGDAYGQLGFSSSSNLTITPVVNSLICSSSNSISGTSEVNATIVVYSGGTQIGTTMSNSSGQWSVLISSLSAGDNITATAKVDNKCLSNVSSSVLVVPTNTFDLASSAPSLCINTSLNPITITTTGATGIGTPIGLPSGVTASWNSNQITLSGTPTTSGTFNYTIPLTGGCGAVSATGMITVNALPIAYTVTGSGTYCLAGTVGLSGSEAGVNYQLYNGATKVGSPVSGTGDAISFGNQQAGTYTVVATISNGDCPAQMTGSAVVTIGDTEKPAITKCLPDGEADCVKNLPAAITTIQGFIDAGGEVTDNCTAPMTVSYNDVITPGSPCKVNRTYTIADALGNKATCIQVFTITDLTKPVISCNDDLVSSPNTSGCAATLDITAPTAISDECSLVNVFLAYNYRLGDNAGSDLFTGTGSFTATFPEGITTINWTITDLCGNTSKPCAQIVQVGFSPAAISYDNGSTANGLGSGVQPMQTSTHNYFVDNKKPESGYTYSWGLFVNNGGVPGVAVDPSFYSITKGNLADVQVTFKNTNSIPEGNYIVSVIKTQIATTCQKQTIFPITVQSNSSFDVAIDNLGNQCQTPSGNLTTISWNVTFPNVITEPFMFSYSVKLGGTVVASGNVANITYVGAIPMLGLSAGAQTSKSANSRAIVIYYSLYGVSGDDLARTVEIEINATDVFQVSEPNRTNNIDDLKINQVPVITFE